MKFLESISLFSRFLLLNLMIGTGPIIGATIYMHSHQNLTTVDLNKMLGFLLMITTLGSLILVPIAVRSVLGAYWILQTAQRRFMFGERSFRLKIEGDLDTVELFRGFNAMADFANEAQQKALQATRESAIARTTQMLAHDVRKPFSILKMSIDLLSRANNMNDFRKILGEITLEVDRALTSVNGMINDVMEIGRTSAPFKETVSSESLIEASLNEVGRLHEGADVKFTYDLKHTHMLFVDPLKVGRVFSNILSNAMQAMKESGNIWIKTAEDDGMITFCLGNNGSFIAAENLLHLFEAFFTKNKKGGTGLGLAIAQKAVLAHGGKIWCESSVEKKTVEFFFTLPVCKDMLSESTAQLPEGSKAIIERYKKSLTQGVSNSSVDESALSSISVEHLERAISSYAQRNGHSLTVAILDDEAIYRNALMALIEETEGIKGAISVEIFSSSQPLLEAFSAKSYDFLICDIDLGRDSMGGYEIVKTLRDQGYKTAICIHSNRSLPEDYVHSVAVGAQAFLPKPLSRLHLLKFMAGILAERDRFAQPGDTPPDGKKPLIAFVDDSETFRKYLPKTMNDADMITYRTPDEFLQTVNINPTLLTKFTAILSDNDFDDLSPMSGLEFADKLRKELNYKNYLILFSSGEFSPHELEGKFDLHVTKGPKKWEEIVRMLPKANTENRCRKFNQKPFNQITEEEYLGFRQLRHDIRNRLSSIEMAIASISEGNLSSHCEIFSEMLRHITDSSPYFPDDLINEMLKSLNEFEDFQKNAARDAGPMVFYINNLQQAFSNLQYHHFYQDPWWDFGDLERVFSPEHKMKAASSQIDTAYGRTIAAKLIPMAASSKIMLHFDKMSHLSNPLELGKIENLASVILNSAIKRGARNIWLSSELLGTHLTFRMKDDGTDEVTSKDEITSVAEMLDIKYECFAEDGKTVVHTIYLS